MSEMHAAIQFERRKTTISFIPEVAPAITWPPEHQHEALLGQRQGQGHPLGVQEDGALLLVGLSFG